MLTPIAADLARSWILLPDGGPPLADRVSASNLVDALAAILPQYAQLQRDLAPAADRLLALGVSNMRAAIMPRRFDEALAAVGDHRPARQRGDEEARERVAAMGRDVRLVVSAAGEPAGHASVDHNDLHPWNMLVTRLDRPHDVRFYDWGDAVVPHPFASMLVPLAWLQNRLGASPGAPEVVRLRDADLHPGESTMTTPARRRAACARFWTICATSSAREDLRRDLMSCRQRTSKMLVRYGRASPLPRWARWGREHLMWLQPCASPTRPRRSPTSTSSAL